MKLVTKIILCALFGVCALMSTLTAIIYIPYVKDTVIIKPTFTAAAYSKNGFYDFYRHECNTTCLTAYLANTDQDNNVVRFSWGGYGYDRLRNLGFENVLTDDYITLHPEVLQKYKTVLLLHNEYVTQEEYNAITTHPHVIYLYPNALYAKVRYNATNNSITLLSGHTYNDTSYAFGYSAIADPKNEFNRDCQAWAFTPVHNGELLNCYPTDLFQLDPIFWLKVKLLA